jgi:hypothetical protein
MATLEAHDLTGSVRARAKRAGCDNKAVAHQSMDRRLRCARCKRRRARPDAHACDCRDVRSRRVGRGGGAVARLPTRSPPSYLASDDVSFDYGEILATDGGRVASGSLRGRGNYNP